jgi:hypothetical protein
MDRDRKIISSPVPIFEAFAVRKEFSITEKLFRIKMINPKVKNPIPIVK